MDIRVGTGDVCTITLDRAVAEELALALAIALGGASDSAFGRGKGRKGRRPDGKTDDNGGGPDAYGGKTDPHGGKTDAYGGGTDTYSSGTDPYGGRTDTYTSRPEPNRGKTNGSPGPSRPGSTGWLRTPAPVGDSRGKTLTSGGRGAFAASARLQSAAKPGAVKPLSAVPSGKKSMPAAAPPRGKHKPKSKSRKKR